MFFILLFDVKILKVASVRNKANVLVIYQRHLNLLATRKIETLIISVFHSVPGVPRVKMERFTGLLVSNSSVVGWQGRNAIRPYFIATRQILLLVSSATNTEPSGNTAIPTGRPYTFPLAWSAIKPVKKSSMAPVGLPLLNGAKTTL